MVIFIVCLIILVIIFFIFYAKVTDIRDYLVIIVYHFIKNWVHHNYSSAKEKAKAEILLYRKNKKL